MQSVHWNRWRDDLIGYDQRGGQAGEMGEPGLNFAGRAARFGMGEPNVQFHAELSEGGIVDTPCVGIDLAHLTAEASLDQLSGAKPSQSAKFNLEPDCPDAAGLVSHRRR